MHSPLSWAVQAVSLSAFDPEVARFYGGADGLVDAAFSLILAAAIVVSMQVLGVTLIAAAIVIPPVVARLLTDNFKMMIVLSTVISGLCGSAGVYLSFFIDVSSGASVVLLSATVFVTVLAYSNMRSALASSSKSRRDGGIARRRLLDPGLSRVGGPTDRRTLASTSWRGIRGAAASAASDNGDGAGTWSAFEATQLRDAIAMHDFSLGRNENCG